MIVCGDDDRTKLRAEKAPLAWDFKLFDVTVRLAFVAVGRGVPVGAGDLCLGTRC